MRVIMGEALISIVIPTYNSGSVLKDAIQSVIIQDYTNFEVCVIDAVSSDNTVALARAFNDPRVKIWSEKDKGIYDAMNKGISVSKGDWIYFMGSDDTLADNAVLRDIHKTIVSSNSSVIYGNVLISGDTSWAKDGDVYDGEFDLNKVINKNICHQSIFYKKSVFDRFGLYSLEYPLSADWDFNLRCWNKVKWLFINRVVAVFHGGGTSTIISEDSNLRRDFFEKIYEYQKIDSFHPSINNSGYACYGQVLKKQKQENPLRHYAERVFKKLNRIIFKNK